MLHHRSIAPLSWLAVVALLAGVSLPAIAEQGASEAATPSGGPGRTRFVCGFGALGSFNDLDVTDRNVMDAYGDGRLDSWSETASYKSRAVPLGFEGYVAFYPVSRVGLSIGFSRYSSAGDAVVTARAEGVPPGVYPAAEDSRGIAWEHSVRTLSIQLRARVLTNDRLTLELFGGPSRFDVKLRTARLVYALVTMRYTVPNTNDMQPLNIFWDADAVTTETASAAEWGLVVGADLTYHISKHVGIGLQAQYGGATVTVPGLIEWQGGRVLSESDPADTQHGLALGLGGFRAAAGLRIRL